MSMTAALDQTTIGSAKTIRRSKKLIRTYVHMYMQTKGHGIYEVSDHSTKQTQPVAVRLDAEANFGGNRSGATTNDREHVMAEEVVAARGKFLYFAYGSNLLDKRIHINNPSAVRKTHAKLEGYRLDFAGFSRRWGGAVATIEPQTNTHMWGAVWELGNEHIESLDRQEGVQDGVYSVLQVNVTSESGRSYKCRTYRYNTKAPFTGGSYGDLPADRRPSPLYLETILRGANQSHLPESYVRLLSSIKSNGHNAGMTLDQLLQNIKMVNRKD
ncbi:gamma-glutamylcyclotransferase-like isoform X2 [Cloeon dipterum]|uniref:gamma-glutamylcyclotransferase-like isoform X2 n=1 Tax=Cloeon dipterum TaxID=197152 RepID=UPI0032200F5C